MKQSPLQLNPPKINISSIKLPINFSENIFDLENSIRTSSINNNKDTFDQLFNLYAQGIELYSIRGDIEMYQDYTNKLNRLILSSTDIPQSRSMHRMKDDQCINSALNSNMDIVNQSNSNSKVSINQTAKKIIQQYDIALCDYVDFVNNDLASQHKLLMKYKKIRNYKSIRKSTVNNVIERTKDFNVNVNVNANMNIDQSLQLTDASIRSSIKKKSFELQSHRHSRKSIKIENSSVCFSLPDNKHFNKLNIYCNANYITKLNAFVEELSKLNALKTKKYVEAYGSLKELDLLLKESDDNFIKDNIKLMISDLEEETEKDNALLDQQFKNNIRYYSQIETRHSISNIKEIVKINNKVIDKIAKII